jgi:hypothetical protein
MIYYRDKPVLDPISLSPQGGRRADVACAVLDPIRCAYPPLDHGPRCLYNSMTQRQNGRAIDKPYQTCP